MRVRLLSRIERLEKRSADAGCKMEIRFGHLRRRLSPNYKGEKHVVVARQLPSEDGLNWVEYEEVPGPDPEEDERRSGNLHTLSVVFVGNSEERP